MRKLLLLILTLLFIACGDTDELPIRDYATAIDVVISVENADGDNLLDPNYEGNILDNIVIEYKDEEYTIIQNDTDSSTTRALPSPQWYGPRLLYWQDSSETVLLFGEFGYCLGEIFTIHWGDGTSDEVKFDFDVDFEGRDREPHFYMKSWLNGELQSEEWPAVTIVK